MPISVLIIGPQRLFAEALATVLEPHPEICIDGVANDLSLMPSDAVEGRADVLLVDIGNGTPADTAIVRQLRQERPDTPIIVLSGLPSERVSESFQAGASAYVHKDRPVEALLEAIRDVATRKIVSPMPLPTRCADRAEGGVSQLTDREYEVLQMLVNGLSNRAISERLDIRPNTVRTHVQNILMKLAVNSRLEALACAVQAGVRPFSEGAAFAESVTS